MTKNSKTEYATAFSDDDLIYDEDLKTEEERIKAYNDELPIAIRCLKIVIQKDSSSEFGISLYRLLDLRKFILHVTSGYIRCQLPNRTGKKYLHVIIAAYRYNRYDLIDNKAKNIDIDHIDRNRLNVNPENLRIVSHRENLYNRQAIQKKYLDMKDLFRVLKVFSYNDKHYRVIETDSDMYLVKRMSNNRYMYLTPIDEQHKYYKLLDNMYGNKVITLSNVIEEKYNFFKYNNENNELEREIVNV